MGHSHIFTFQYKISNLKRLIGEKEEILNNYDDDYAFLKNDLDSTLDGNRKLKVQNVELEVSLINLKLNWRFE
jgi:hypothetical protein